MITNEKSQNSSLNNEESLFMQLGHKKFDTYTTNNKNCSSMNNNKNIDLTSLSTSKRVKFYTKLKPYFKSTSKPKKMIKIRKLHNKSKSSTIDINQDAERILNHLLSNMSTTDSKESKKDCHVPKLCVEPEKIYIKELQLKKKQFEIYKAQFIKVEKDMKVKQRETLNEKNKKQNIALNISNQLKAAERQMLNYLKRSNSPYSNRWANIMLEKSYNSKMKIAGFLNGVPKYEIIPIPNRFKQRKIEKEYHSNVNERVSNLPNITSPQRTLKGSLSQRNYNYMIAYPDIYKHFQ